MDFQTIIIVGVILGFLISQIVRQYFKHIQHLAHLQLSAVATLQASSEYITERILHHQISTAIHLTHQSETAIMLPLDTYTERLRGILRVYQIAGAIESWELNNKVQLPEGWKEPEESMAYLVIKGIVDRNNAKEVHELLLEASNGNQTAS